jgi:hypothetical protein
MDMRTGLVPLDRISRAILTLRGQRVILDRELAAIYGVTTKRLNEQVRRNRGRFPADFMFRLTVVERARLRSQFATLDSGRGEHAKYLPYAFTEHGAIQAANVLKSRRSVSMGIYVVRAFVRMREVLASNAALARKLALLERSLATLDARTQRQFHDVYSSIRALLASPTSKHRGIGFTADLDEP